MQPRHLYAAGFALAGAVCGVLAVTMTWAFAVAAILCFVGGLVIERGWPASWRAFVRSVVPFDVRSPVVRKAPPTRPAPPLGYLDFDLARIEAMKRLASTMREIQEESDQAAAMIASYRPALLASGGAPVERQIELNREFGRKLHSYAVGLESREATLRAETEAMTTNWMRRIEAFPPDEDLTALRSEMVSIQDAILSRPRAGMIRIRDGFTRLRARNIQQEVNQADDRMILAATKIVADFDRISEFATQAIALIDQRSQQSATKIRPRESAGPVDQG